MKKRVTFEVDDSALFDLLAAMNGDHTLIGARVVSALLAEPGTADLIGMAYYGVDYVGSEPVSEEQPS